MAFLYGAAGIASAVYASQWAKPPEPCDKYFLFELFDCDNTSLTATTALSAVRGTNAPTHHLRHFVGNALPVCRPRNEAKQDKYMYMCSNVHANIDSTHAAKIFVHFVHMILRMKVSFHHYRSSVSFKQ